MRARPQPGSVTPAHTAPAIEPRTPPEGAAPPRTPRAAFAAAILAFVVLVVGTVGPPLIGQGTLLAADQSTWAAPWQAYESPAEHNPDHHGPVNDTTDAAYPTRAAVAEALIEDDLFEWNPYVVGGTAAASESSSGSLGPFALLYTVLPNWYAPAAIKLLQMAVAAGFTFLFCRLIGVGRVPAIFAGTAFAGSGFMVMWTNWQQPEVAAGIAALFWATERYLQRPSAPRAVPIAVALAVMLLGNFPAVVGYALYALAGYVLVRLVRAEDRTVPQRVAVAGGTAAGVVTGVLLVATVLIPFALRLGELAMTTRAQASDDNLGLASLLTAVAPKALGLSTEGPAEAFFGVRNQVEAVSFVGVTTVVLVVVALCLPRPRSTPRGTRLALGLPTLVLGVATYGGGPVLAVLQELPVFEDNFVGRTRSLLGFSVAVLAGIGLQALSERLSPSGRRSLAVAAAVLAVVVGVGALAVTRAFDLAGELDRTGTVTRGLVVPLVVGIAALALLPVVRSRRDVLRDGAMVGLVVLLVVESLILALPLVPNEDPELLFPETPGIAFLADNLGHERVAPEGFTLWGTATTLFGIRSATGHAFTTEAWREALTAVDPTVYDRSPTFSLIRAEPAVVTSGILDRLGVRWFAAGDGHVPLGTVESGQLASASCDRPVVLDSPATVVVPAANGLRGLVVRTCGTVEVPRSAVVEATATAGTGTAEGRVPLPTTLDPTELAVAVPADGLGGDGELTVTLEMAGPSGDAVALAASATGGVAADVIRPADDGLRLAYADDLRIYERTRALPRIRWAGTGTVVENGERRLDLLAAGAVADDAVVLSQEGPAGSGAGGTVDVTLDVATAITVEVDAEGDGYLVVADAMQSDWVATVDGVAVDLVDAEHAGVAIEVPEGRHVVELRYRPRGQRLGVVISLLTALALAAVVAVPRIVAARRTGR